MPTLSKTAESINPENYKYLQQLVYTGSGIVLEQDKQYLLEARLTGVARQHNVAGINDLCNLLRGTRDAGVKNQVIDAMTTNETYFFREPTHYDAIRTKLLPALRELRGTTKKLSFWSSASSSGQEAYSLAMMLYEQGFEDWNVQILGTDLSTQMLTKARSGRYLQIEVNRGLPTALLVKHFRRHGLEWDLKDHIKKMARFESFDLRQKMRSLGPFDLVFCRNVLVYFDAATRKEILREMHGTLFRGGWLLLGAAETPAGLEHLYERHSLGSTSYYTAL
ncbi:MAG: protein-glutamate O-methyltransferase CheR [Bryobacterales bacterium]|nr:protein-glutamate O-methyltransferase CheR [Bryobacterales bacterium]